MARYDDEQDFDEKRLQRRQRRKRSQMMAYAVLGTIIAIIILIISASVYIVGRFNHSGSAEPLAESGSENSAVEEEEETAAIETPDEPDEYTEDDMLTDIVNSVISEMPIEDKVASLFITTPEQLTGVDTAVKAGTGTQEALSNYSIGGIAYSPKNIKSPEQISEMLDATASMSKYPIFTIAPFISISSDNVRESLGIAEAEEPMDAEATAAMGKVVGEAFGENGFNLLMAPSADISEEGFYSSDVEKARDQSLAFAQGLSESGIASCAHIFPFGLADSALGLAQSDISRDDLVLNQYEVFKNLIDNDAISAIMVSDASIPALTGDNTPCTLSPEVIQNELRGTLGYDGIVITAPFNDGAITVYYTQSEAAVAAITSGADMIYLPDDFTEAYDGLLSAVQSGTISEDRIDESLRRIFAVKYADRVDQISQED